MLTRGWLLVGDSAPEALSVVLPEAACDDVCALAKVRLLRGDVVDAGVVVLVVIPVKISFEVSHGLGVVQKLARIFRGAFDGREGCQRSVKVYHL